MAQTLSVKPPYTLERTGEDQVTMHFDVHALPRGGWSEVGPGLGLVMIVFGWLPGIIVHALFNAPKSETTTYLVAGWIASVVIPFILAKRSASSKRARGSRFARLIFTPDSVQTTGNQILSRQDISGSFWRTPDTSFTYKNRTSYKLGKARANHLAERAIEVGVDYGGTNVMLTHQTLTKHQGQKIADAVAWWRNDPKGFLNEAVDTYIAAE